jgi:glycosyltransferase involved in cell wall biosynthesis
MKNLANKKIKVAVISGFYPGGGVVTYIKNLYSRLNDSKFLEIYLFLDSPNKSYDKIIKSYFPTGLHLKIIRVPKIRFAKGIVFIIKLLMEVNFKNFDFIEVHHTTYAGILSNFIPKEKLIIITHGPDVLDERMNNLLYRILAKKAYNRAIAISTHTHQEIDKMIRLGVDKEKIVFFPCGVDINGIRNFKKTNLREELSIKNKYILCTTYGKNYRRKGTHVLLKALPEIMKKDVSVVLTGQMFKDVFPLVKEAQEKYKGRFFWIGFRNDIPNILANSDMYILPSLIEGMSVSLLEGMASGKACIATKGVGENQYSLGDAGILVKPGSSKEIGEAVKLLIENPNLMKKLGEKAQEKSKQFSWDKIAKNEEEFIRNILVKKNKGLHFSRVTKKTSL